MKGPYISKVSIKNYRNFKDTEVLLSRKQVIIGENNVGKTNFLRAIQLLLDRNFSEVDRTLDENDFHDNLVDPMKNGEEITITLEIQGFEHNRKLVAKFADALISDTPPTLKLQYRFFPSRDEHREITGYQYAVCKGSTQDKPFTADDRSFLNFQVIRALRDAERELAAGKRSPLYKIVKLYDIAEERLQEIADGLKAAADKILDLNEIQLIKEAIQERFNTLSGVQHGHQINLRTFDIDPERLLYTLQVYMGLKERPVSELSLGLANILYVGLMLLLIKDRTIPLMLSSERYAELEALETEMLLAQAYKSTEESNYALVTISPELSDKLYEFMDRQLNTAQSFSILAVEEPEAHLHPIMQRLLYREVLHKSDTSVLFTSHSTFITSVAPLESIVHLRREKGATSIYSTAALKLASKDCADLERYTDARRGELYFGKGVLLVEGIGEEYLVPQAAILLGMPLDQYGIVVCNINSTHFEPYVRLLQALCIPWALITDGDYYTKEKTRDPITGDSVMVKRYHVLLSDEDANEEAGFMGNERTAKLLVTLGLIKEENIPEEIATQDTIFATKGCFIGHYTLEVDVMETTSLDNIEIIKGVFKEIQPDSFRQQKNFSRAIDDKHYYTALDKIDSKGYFSQRLASKLKKQMIPQYIKNAITYIITKVKPADE